MPNVKELSKDIASFLAASPSLPIPNGLQSTIEAFIQKHKPHDDQCAETLHVELLSLYRKHVAASDPVARTPPFFDIVLRLSANLRSQERVKEWYDLGRDFIDEVLNDRALVEESSTWLPDYLEFGNSEGNENLADTPIAVNPLLDKLVDKWAADYHLGFMAGAQDYSEKQLRDTMVQYGKKYLKRFFVCMDRFLVRKETRKAALSLLIELVQTQPPRLHLIMQTPLFTNILRCLQHDISTSVVSSALTLLLMILPNMPSALAAHLSVLFNIYARLLFWSRDGADLGLGFDATSTPYPTAPSGWEVLPPSPDDGQHIPRLANYFTILYGLFPINFMEYIRKPHRYLRHFDASRADDVEVEATEIRQKSEPFRQRHIIHPNFYTTTIESEKTDFERWQNSAPADITAECMALCLASEAGGENCGRGTAFAEQGLAPFLRDTATVAELDGALHAQSPPINRLRNKLAEPQAPPLPTGTLTPSLRPHAQLQSSRPSSVRNSAQASAAESPAILAQVASSPASQAQLQDMIHHNRAIKLAIGQSLPNDSVPSLALSQAEPSVTDMDKLEETARREKSGTDGASHKDNADDAETQIPTREKAESARLVNASQHVAQLQRQVTLLQNDLRFERYLRQQHIAHIGSLRRKQLLELATEAETQKLILSNRNMKNRIEEAKKAEMQARKESEKSRAMSKKWESDMYMKLRAAKEDAKKTKAEGDVLRRELAEAREDCERLKVLLCASEAAGLASRQHWETAQEDLAKVERLEAELQRLKASEDGDGAEAETDEDLSSTPTASSAAHVQLESLRMQLAARDHDLEAMRDSYEAQILQLKKQILLPLEDDKRRPRPDPSLAAAHVLLDLTVASSKAKQADLQTQYDALARKHTELQSTLLEMRTSVPPAGSPAVSYYESPLASPSSPASRRGPSRSRSRLFSEPETLDGGASFNAIPPLDTRNAANSPTIGGVGGPLSVSTHWALEGGVPLPSEGRISSRSPAQHISGLHLPRGRKDGKEKKSSGLRGLSRLTGSSSTS